MCIRDSYNYRLTFFSLLFGLFSAISAQSNATISEVFFLDLGIVIEPTTGDEKYNRECPNELRHPGMDQSRDSFS